MANALLTFSDALGDVDELLSGDFATPFDRSSHHQIWSEAMIVAPAIRGLLGITTDDGGHTIRVAPAPPAWWDHVEARGLAAGSARYDLSYARTRGSIRMRLARVGGGSAGSRLEVAVALPLDARVRQVAVNRRRSRPEIQRIGDIQRVAVAVTAASAEVTYSFDEGTEPYVDIAESAEGARSQGLRILRSRAERAALHLLVEGLAGRTYELHVRTPHRLGPADGLTTTREAAGWGLQIRFDGNSGDYVRRDITLPLLP